MKVEARLRAFTGFVRRRSFSGAAEELRISQPAVSKHIADLEKELRVSVFYRTTRLIADYGLRLAFVFDGTPPPRKYSAAPTDNSSYTRAGAAPRD